MVYEKEGRKEGMGEEWYKRRKEGRNWGSQRKNGIREGRKERRNGGRMV